MLNAIVLFPEVSVILASETLLREVTAFPVETLNLTFPVTITDAPLASAKTRNQNSQSVKSAIIVDLRELVSAPRYCKARNRFSTGSGKVSIAETVVV